MNETLTRPARRSARRELNALIARAFTAIGIAGALTVALLVAAEFDTFAAAWRVPMALLPLPVAVAVAAGLWIGRRGHIGVGNALVLAAGFTAVTLFPLANGTGLRSTMPGYYALIIVAAGVFVSVRAAVVWGVLSLLALLAMFGAEQSGLLDTAAASGRLPIHQALALNAVLVVFGTGMAAVLAHSLVFALRSSKDQEHRFRQLLTIAADSYWEQDDQLRFTVMAPISLDAPAFDPAHFVGKRRWELPEIELTPQQWAAHQADLAAHRPFRNLLLSRPDTLPRYARVSGEPVFDERGGFQGYWGISRVVDDEVQAQRRLEASEQLYRELFTRAPSAFILHRGGRVLQANAAAARLFGFMSPEVMVGTVMLELNHPHARAQSTERLAQMESAEIGAVMPTAELHLRHRDGSDLFVEVLVVRVAAADGPANLSIHFDLTARRAAKRALAEAKEHADRANQAKSRFLANMSHEIRTPLNGVLGLAQLAQRSGLDNERLQKYLTQLVASAQDLSHIVSAVLDLSKIEAGELNTESIVFDLRGVLDSLGIAFGELARQKNLSWRMVVDAAVPRFVRGDPTRLKQILSNYLGNAIKFTARGSVELQVHAGTAERLRFNVRDTGSGIDEATVPRLFVPFMQADDSTSRRFGGTGLGLAICRELARLLGGEVGVHSQPGHGSEFWVELPLPAQPLVPADSHPALPSLRGLRLLLVEDNAVNMMIADAMLADWGALVTCVTDGQAALAAFEHAGGAFDAVLMDVHMPVLGGLEATAALRKLRTAEQLPIIGLTAAVLTDELRAATAAGMNDCLSKPYSAAQLRDMVARWTVARPAAGGGPAATGVAAAG